MFIILPFCNLVNNHFCVRVIADPIVELFHSSHLHQIHNALCFIAESLCGQCVDEAINFGLVLTGPDDVSQDHLAALESRCHYLDLTIDTEREKILRIKQIVEDGMLESYEFQPWDIDEILNFIDNNKKKLRELSLRMVLKLADLKKSFPDRWTRVAEVSCMRRS